MIEAILPFTQPQSIAHALLVMAIVPAVGLALGAVRYRGIALGPAAVVFAGIVFGYFGQRIDPAILGFARDFGLIMFIFSIGLQLGPGFPSVMREQGLRLNLLAAATVCIGVFLAIILAKLLRIDAAATLGILAGATTNTPSLGATQQAMTMLPGISAQRAELPGLAYAVTYPAGVAGIIGLMLAVRWLFRIDSAREAMQYHEEQRQKVEPIERMNLIVENPALENLSVAEVPARHEAGVVISRIRHAGESEAHVALADEPLQQGDTLLAVGTRAGLQQFARVVGRAAATDLAALPGHVTHRRVIVTHKAVLGKTVQELGLDSGRGVTATRLTRGDVQVTATPALRLRFGDVLQLVGRPDDLAAAANTLGNSLEELNQTHFIPLFVGVAIGVIVGMLPIKLPGLSVPVRLGLAAGPLIVAIALSWVGHLRGLVWHVPLVANLAFRRLGVALFLSAVGLAAGERFFATLFTRAGLTWLLCGVAVTTVPLILLAAVARGIFHMNFTTLSGLIAGTTTDTNALTFASELTGSEGPQVAYAAVYPFSMLLRVIAAQTLALTLCR
jgi:putative transport protein